MHSEEVSTGLILTLIIYIVGVICFHNGQKDILKDKTNEKTISLLIPSLNRMTRLYIEKSDENEMLKDTFRLTKWEDKKLIIIYNFYH